MAARTRDWWGGAAVVSLVFMGAARADEAGTLAALKKAGATVLYVDNDPKKPARAVYLPGPKVTDADLKHLAALKELKTLKLDAASKVTDAGVKELAGLKGLRHLNLNFTKVTDASVKVLSGLTKLETLGLSFSQVTPEGAKKLKEALPKCKIIR